VQECDVVVAGAGPAGRALAAELAARGLEVALVSPGPLRPWTATLSGWWDELAPLDAFDRATMVRRAFPDVYAVDGRGTRTRLGRTYLVLDNAGTAGALHRRLLASGHGEEHDDRVQSWRSCPDRVVVTAAGGTTWRARLLVDASGGVGGLDATGGRPAPRLWQWAYGVTAQLENPPGPPGAAVLMDWTLLPGLAGEPDGAPASFLYVLDWGDGHHLVEETILAGPRIPGVVPVLRRRLEARLGAYGVTVGAVRHTERVAIPLDIAPPRAGSRGQGPILRFGVAAGLVHPASGYSVTSALSLAPAVADTVAAGIRSGLGPHALATAGTRSVWPPARRLARLVAVRGIGTTRGLGAKEMGEFFTRFFALGPGGWSGYLAQPPAAWPAAATMSRLWWSMPWPERAQLARRFLGLDLRWPSLPGPRVPPPKQRSQGDH
jgi:lycopene beta-cyclase